MTSAGILANWPTNDELIAKQLCADAEFLAEWERTAGARAMAVAMVHYRAERDLSLQELAGLVGVATAQIAGLEAGDADPSADAVTAISAQLGIEPGAFTKRVGPRRLNSG